MKNLSKIISRYLLSAVLMLFITLFLNVFLYVVSGFQVIRATKHNVSNSS